MFTFFVPSRKRGFTLMETLLAIALVGVLLSLYLTIFVPARGLVRQALSRQEAERITSNLRAELNTLHPGETASATAKTSSPGRYLSAFDKAFYMMQASRRPSSSLVIFSYRADTSKEPRSNGMYPSVPAAKNVPGYNCQLVTAVGRMNDKDIRETMKDAVGPVFLVKLTQLVAQSNGEYVLAKTPGSIRGAGTPEQYVSAPGEKDAWGGVIFCRADFYLLSPPNPERYRNRSWARMGRPLFSSNLSFHR